MAKQSQVVAAPSQPEGSRTNGPLQTIRHRNIRAAIWKNESESGPFFTVTVTRGYKDDAGEWHDTGSFGYDDLLVVAKLMYDAHSAITAARAKERSSSARSSNAKTAGA